jgi:hypothetical protein
MPRAPRRPCTGNPGTGKPRPQPILLARMHPILAAATMHRDVPGRSRKLNGTWRSRAKHTSVSQPEARHLSERQRKNQACCSMWFIFSLIAGGVALRVESTKQVTVSFRRRIRAVHKFNNTQYSSHDIITIIQCLNCKKHNISGKFRIRYNPSSPLLTP